MCVVVVRYPVYVVVMTSLVVLIWFFYKGITFLMVKFCNVQLIFAGLNFASFLQLQKM